MSRPHIYPTKILQDKHLCYLKSKAQAKLRGELFEITIEEYMNLWTDDLWNKKGRGSDNLSWTRKDPTKPWNVDNILIMTRLEQIRYVQKLLVRKRRAKQNV